MSSPLFLKMNKKDDKIRTRSQTKDIESKNLADTPSISVETLPGYTSPENNVELSPDALPPVKYNGAVSQEYFRTPIPGASGVMHQRRPIIPEDLPDSGSYGCQKGSESVSSEDSTLDGIQVTGNQQGKAPFCTDKIEGKKKVGDIWQDQEECIQKRCLADSQGTPLISYAGCGAVGTTDPKCHLIEPDDNSTYPHCCPKIVCDD